VCGLETVLVDEVVSTIEKDFPVSDWNKQKFVVGVTEDIEIWEGLFATAIDGGNMLTVVYEFEDITNKELLSSLLEKKSKTHKVVLVSREPRIEKVPEKVEDETVFLLPMHLREFEKKGKIIECHSFTQSNAKTAVAWIKTKIDAYDGAVVHLLNESNNNLRLVRDVVQKLNWMNEKASIRNVSILLNEEPSESFSDALLALDKKTAMLALNRVDESDYLQLIGQLDSQVELAGKIHDLLVQHKSIPDIMRTLKSQAFLVPQLSKTAKHYSRSRRLLIRNLLAETDRRIRRGSSEGVLESLVVLW